MKTNSRQKNRLKILTLCCLALLALTSLLHAGSPQIIVTKKSVSHSYDLFFGYRKALNTATGETLVIWHEDYVGVLGQLISPGGALKGKTLYIADRRSGDSSDPACCTRGNSIAYNPVTREYLVLYTGWRAKPGSILAVRLNSVAKVIAKEFTVIQTISPGVDGWGENAFPLVQFNPQTNGYTLIWDRTDGIAAALLDASGKLTGPIVNVMEGFPLDDPIGGIGDGFNGRLFDVEWIASANKFAVVFQQRFTDQPPANMGGGQADLWLATLDPLLRSKPILMKINTAPILVGASDWGYWRASLAILPDGSASVYYADQQTVKGRAISKLGKLSGRPFQAFSGPLDQPLHDPTVAFSTTSKGTVGLLIGYGLSPASNSTWAQVLDSRGRPIGSSKMIETFYFASGSQLLALPRKPSDTAFQFVWIQPRLTQPGTGGVLKLNLEVRP